MNGPVFTPAMLESALEHFHNRAEWKREVRTTGVILVLFQSSRVRKNPVTYRTDTERCNCPGFEYHGGICSHVLAVKLDEEHTRRMVGRKVVTAP